MGRVLDAITDELAAFIAAQRVFFVATAPTDGGHVNLSPKGLDTFTVLDPSKVAYLDLTGSGVETIAHLRDNGRITLMFCAFEGPPMIVRVYGRGSTLVPADPGFADLRNHFPAARKAVRAVIAVHIDEVRTSCGYGVPLMDYAGDRDDQDRWADRKGEDGLVRYRAEKNAFSLDGLPGL